MSAYPVQCNHHNNIERGTLIMSNTTSSISSFIPECNISFSGGDLSSDTGAILPLDFITSSQLLDPYENLPYLDSRSSFEPHNSNQSLLAQLVFRFIAGYFVQSDQKVLEEDPLLSRYFSRISSQSSVSRFFQRVTEDTNNQFWKLFSDQSCRFLDSRLDEILLDADSTKTDTYGKQEGSAFISHYQQVGYHPFVVNEFSTRMLVGAWMRTGNTYSAAEAPAIMEEVLSRFSDTGPSGSARTVLFRGDAAFYQNELMTLFENRPQPVRYAIRAKGSGSLEAACLDDFYGQKDRENYDYSAADPFYGEIQYRMSEAEGTRRVCYKLYFTEGKSADQRKLQKIALIPCIFAVITNLEDRTPESVIQFYCERGSSENFTKELKNDFGANTLSHRTFTANTFEFLLKCLSYNLFRMFQILVLEGTDARMTCSSFRKKYQKTASRVSRHARSLHLSIASTFRYRERFMKYLRKARQKWNL